MISRVARLTAAMIFITMIISSCAGLNNNVIPDGCENSLIYKEAAKLGVTPQLIGTIFQLANLELIKNDVVAKADISQFLDDVESLLDRDQTTYLDVVNMVVSRVSEIQDQFGPEVIVLITAFSQQLSEPIPIDDCDRQLLLQHIEDQRRVLETVG